MASAPPNRFRRGAPEPPPRFARGAPLPETMPKMVVVGGLEPRPAAPPAPPANRFTRGVPYTGKVKGLPTRKRGRRSHTDRRNYDLDVKRFCERVLEWDKLNTFRMSARGWCYLLEQHGEITKGEFDAASALINECRKNGMLPVDIVSQNERTGTDGIERLAWDNVDGQCDALEKNLILAPYSYCPISFWNDQQYYVEMAVEKSDLKSLFLPTCLRWHVSITNLAGWSDLLSRSNMLVRMYNQSMEGRTPVLLYHQGVGFNLAGTKPMNVVLHVRLEMILVGRAG